MQDRIIAPENLPYDGSAAKVPRKKRGSSPAAAVRHLLRHLNDPQELAGNPLTSDIFRDRIRSGLTMRDALRLVREAVTQCIDRITQSEGDSVVRERNSRAATILRRCDIDGAAHAQVAAELGLSRRQFYRDRSLALQLLATEMEDRIQTPQSGSAAAADLATLAYESVEALLAVGQFDHAKAALERISRSACAPEDRIRACCDLVDIHCEDVRHAGAAQALESAREIWSQLPQSRSATASARMALANAQYATLLCNHANAEHHRREGLASLRGMAHSPAVAELLTRTLLADAASLRERGDQRAAIAALDEAEASLDPRRPSSLLLEALILNEKGAAFMLLPGGLSDASRLHQRAAQLARERRFMRIALASLLNDCAVDHWQGKTKSALAAAREVLEAARGVAFTQEFARMAMLVSSFALAVKETNTALDLLAEAKQFAQDGGSLHSRALLSEARLHLQTGSHRRAIELASEACGAVESAGARALLGTALLYAAEGYAALGDRRAIGAVTQAIAELERGGSPFNLCRAHRLAGKLTGAKSHAKRAKEIATTFAVPRSRS